MCEYPTGVLFNLIKTHVLTSEQARRTDSLNVTVRHRLQQGNANQATPCVVPLLEKVPIAPAARVGRWQRRATLQEEQVGWCGVLHIRARRKTPCQAARSPLAPPPSGESERQLARDQLARDCMTNSLGAPIGDALPKLETTLAPPCVDACGGHQAWPRWKALRPRRVAPARAVSSPP